MSKTLGCEMLVTDSGSQTFVIASNKNRATLKLYWKVILLSIIPFWKRMIIFNDMISLDKFVNQQKMVTTPSMRTAILNDEVIELFP